MKNIFSKIDWLKSIWFHIIGIACIIWFLVRVLPKPDRIRYPCQQMSITIAISYIAFWSALSYGLLLWIKRVKSKTTGIAPALLAVLVILILVSGPLLLSSAAPLWTPVPKEPMGTPKGANPGRVVWVWDPDCTDWDGSPYWWYSSHNDQDVLEQMFSDGIQALAGESTDYDAWDALFRYFNQEHGNGNVSYQSGEKICIKINMNSDNSGYDYEHNYINSNPYVIKSLFRDLVNVVGVNQEDITVYDASRYLANWWWDRATDEFPNITGVDKNGGASGREKYVGSSTYIHFWDGQSFALPTCLVNAKYFINVPCMKMHAAGRVTIAGKNLFGAWNPNVANMHDYMEYGEAAMGNAAPQADLLLHEDLGGKTLLALGDATWCVRNYNYNIEKWQMYPFNNDYPSSLFFTQDVVALDSVLYDFLWVERNGYPWEGAQNYLHEVADPPDGRYDPEGDGTYVSASLGVHEHCDPDIDIFSVARYSGPSNNGIDYVPIDDGDPPNYPPTISNENPSNGQTNVPTTTSSLSVTIEDPEADSFDWTIQTSPDIGSSSGTGEYNGTKSCSVSGLSYDTTYTWYVNATDSGSGQTTEAIYTFTTEILLINNPPIVSNENPSNGQTSIPTTTSSLSVTIEDPEADSFDWTIQTSPDIGSSSGTGEYNGTKSCSVSGLSYDTTYTWYVNATDSGSGQTTEAIYTFTTETPPVISNIAIATSNPLDTDSAFGWINITCDVTDDISVDEVYLNITRPDGSWNNVSMSVGVSNSYYYNSSIAFSTHGNYSYFVWAKDISCNTDISGSYDFSMSPNWDINNDGECNLLDLVLISNVYGESGALGWIREDVDNNGDIQILDLVLISNHYDKTWWI